MLRDGLILLALIMINTHQNLVTIYINLSESLHETYRNHYTKIDYEITLIFMKP
jgi:hypothetical protein